MSEDLFGPAGVDLIDGSLALEQRMGGLLLVSGVASRPFQLGTEDTCGRYRCGSAHGLS